MTLRASFVRFTLAVACTGFAANGLAQEQVAPDAKGRMAMEAAFSRADADGDGKVSKEEAGRLPAIAVKFDLLDKDQDGTLTLSEFAAGYSPAG